MSGGQAHQRNCVMLLDEVVLEKNKFKPEFWCCELIMERNKHRGWGAIVRVRG